jgi:drug/metabolite transporter (DMT)-like permease
MIGEKLKPIDIFLILITCAGVTLITLGFGHTKEELNEVDDAKSPLLAKLGALTVPFLLSYGNILMSKLKGLNENTVSLYMNPATAVLMISLTYAEGLDFSIFGEATFTGLDWAIMIGVSILSVVTQTLKFVALQNEQPAKISHYQYFVCVY